jgi:DNA-binding transcriptional regulator YiaG
MELAMEDRAIKDHAAYEAMTDYWVAAIERRGVHDVRAKIALLVCCYWEHLEQEWTPLATLTPQDAVDQIELALELRTGERTQLHDKIVAHWPSDWSAIDLRSQDGIDLTAEPTPIGKLDSTPVSSREVCHLRAYCGLTPEAFGALLGVSRQRVYVWESEGTSSAHPTVSALLRLYLATFERVRKR